MYTYTTPTITCTLDGVEFDQVDCVRIAVKSKSSSVIKVVPVADIDTATGNATVTLSQDETAALGAGQISIQARIRYKDGTVQATNKVFKDMDDVLDKVVI